MAVKGIIYYFLFSKSLFWEVLVWCFHASDSQFKLQTSLGDASSTQMQKSPIKFLRYDLNASSDYHALRSYFSLLVL